MRLSIEYSEAMRNWLRVTALLLIAAAIAACQASAAEQPLFSGKSALDFAAQQVSFGPRIPGSEGHARTAQWIENQLETFGWRVGVQSFEYRGVMLENIIAGPDGALDGAPIILGAHYDTRPIADRDERRPDAPVPGANDGASGVAVLLELARVLDTKEARDNVWLVFFDGEDSGDIDDWEWVVGSSYFAEQLEMQPQAVIIVDMVGDKDLDIFYERNSNVELMVEIWRTAQSLGYTRFIAREKYAMLDDHTPFLRLGFKAVDIIDFDYPYWHTTEDTIDKISAESLEAVGRTLQTWLAEAR